MENVKPAENRMEQEFSAEKRPPIERNF